MSNNGCILTREQYVPIFRTSFLLMGTTVYSLYRGHYYISIIPGGIFITSINYWRKPDYSWRRYLDIYYVHLSIAYQTVRVYGSRRFNIYFSLIGLTCLSYMYGVYLYKKKKEWMSVYMHCLVHLLGNLACITIYSGEIIPCESNLLCKWITNS
jgi:hypothetical protein